MQSGVYVKTEGRTGVGMFYLFRCLSRHHTTGEVVVVYTPLRVEPEWYGTLRDCHIERAEFERKFKWVAEGLPDHPLVEK